MLTYLNGIGASRRKSGASHSRSQRRAGAGKFKGALKVLKKLPPAQATKYAKGLVRKASPLNAIRIKKALKQARHREVMEEAGEPLYNDSQPTTPEFIQEQSDNAEAEGIEEVDSPEFSDSDTGGENMEEEINGIYYPTISGKAERKAKKKSKTDKKQATADKKRSKGEASKLKAQARIEKARAGGGKFKESFDKALDTAGKYLDKGKGGEADAPKPSFFEENKALIIGGGALLLIGGFMLMKKK